MRGVAIARTMTRAAAVLTVLAAFLPAGPASAATQAARAADATRPAASNPAVRRLVNKSAISQLITVTAVSSTSTYATFRAYQVTGARHRDRRLRLPSVTELLKVLRWLKPADSPKIDISAQ